jgi:hypothetical protein
MAFETHAIFALLRRRLKGGEERVTPYRQRRRRHTGPTRNRLKAFPPQQS